MSAAAISDVKPTSKHWFWGVVATQKSLIILILVASFFANIFAFAVSLFSMVVYDRILPNNAVDSLISMLVGLVIILALDYLVRQIRSEFLEYAGKKIDEVVNNSLFNKIVMKSGYAQTNSSAVSVSIVKDFDVIREFMAAATVTTIVDIPFAFLFLLVIFIISGPLVLIPVISIAILLVIGFYSNYKMRSASGLQIKAGRGKQAFLYECLTARDSIVCFGKDEFFENKWRKAIKEQGDNTTNSKKIGNNATNAVNLITQANQILIVSAGVVATALTGSLIATTLLAGRAIAPFSAVVNLLTRLSQATQAFRSISKALNSTIDTLPDGMIEAPSKFNGIKIDHLSIKYEPEKPSVIDGISLEMNHGDRIAILGKTGSGKSTLLRAILGLIPINQGTIKFNGLDLSDYDRESFISKFSVLHQDTHLFEGTIIENIALTKELVDADKVLSASNISGFSQVLESLPNGLNTVIGENGRGLSGGQKRLLALARLVYSNSDIVVMDEPTGSLDPATEAVVVKNFEHYLMNSQLVVFVTHRPAPLRFATKILIMDKGKVIEYDSRDKVLEKINSKKTAI